MTKEEDDRARDFEERDEDRALAFIQERIEVADKLFSQTIGGLFIGNAGAALGAVAFIRATWKDGTFPKAFLLPLALFMCGPISMGVGIALALWRERGVIVRNQNAKSLLDIISRDFQSPLGRVGLAPGDWRMIMACCSGAFFVVGCVAGVALLACR
jgi:hypothetical protein